MKHLLKRMTIAALGALLAVSCGKDNGNTILPKPVITEDMYSVAVNMETGEVVFSFTADAMSAFWTVNEPVGITTSFNGREVPGLNHTLNLSIKGCLNGLKKYRESPSKQGYR